MTMKWLLLCLLLSACLGFSTVSRDWKQPREATITFPLFGINQQQPSRTTATYDDGIVQQQIDEYLEVRRSQQQIDEYLMVMDPSADMIANPQITKQEDTKSNLMQKIKDSGIAGIVSFGVVQLAFWALSFPLVILAFCRVTGHFPDFGDSEDMAKLGAESFTFVNIARLAAPFRIGFALSLSPWIQANLIDPIQNKINKQE
jgi:hypothetical protein